MPTSKLTSSIVPELEALARIAEVLEPLDEETCQRVLAWAFNKFSSDQW